MLSPPATGALAAGAFSPVSGGSGVGVLVGAVVMAVKGTEGVLPVILLGLLGLVFAGIGGGMLYVMTRRAVFDKDSGYFWKGRRDPQMALLGAAPGEFTPLTEIHAIQILSERCHSDGESSGTYYSYELNLVLQDGTRVHVVDHGNQAHLRDDADALGTLGARLVRAAPQHRAVAGLEVRQAPHRTRAIGGADARLTHRARLRNDAVADADEGAFQVGQQQPASPAALDDDAVTLRIELRRGIDGLGRVEHADIDLQVVQLVCGHRLEAPVACSCRDRVVDDLLRQQRLGGRVGKMVEQVVGEFAPADFGEELR